MRILVTGVGGFVGTVLVKRLAAAGQEVLGTYLGSRPEVPGVELRPLDVMDKPSLTRTLEDFAPDSVVHLAGFSHVGESWKRMADYFRVNVLGVENLLAAAGNRRFVLASSAEVYGRVDEAQQPITEDHPVAPRNPYAMTKAAAERLTLARDGIVARMFNIVGPGQDVTFALPSFARQLAAVAAGGPARLAVGNLDARRDFLHIEDAAEAWMTLIRAGEPGGVYNLGSGSAVSIRRALELLIEVAGVEVTPEIDPERFRPADVDLTSADNRRLRALGWEPRRTLRQALEDLWRAAVERQAN